MKVLTVCPSCKKKSDIEVSQQGYFKWQDGELIQNAMPELNDDQREQLLTGICPPCWERLFNGENGDGE
jgi:hypothetical protein